MMIKNKIYLWKRKTMAFWQKTRHFGKITAFTAFDGTHGFRDFHDYLLSLFTTDISQGMVARPHAMKRKDWETSFGRTECGMFEQHTGWPKKVSYGSLSISSLNVDQFSHFFSPVDSVRNLLLTGMHTTPTMSLHYLVKHKDLKTNNIYRWTKYDSLPFLGHPVHLTDHNLKYFLL